MNIWRGVASEDLDAKMFLLLLSGHWHRGRDTVKLSPELAY